MSEILSSFQVEFGPDSPVPSPRWKIWIQTEDSEYHGWTTLRLVTSVLETALVPGRKGKRWPIEVEIDEKTGGISRVRIQDDRDCKAGLELSDGATVYPLTPTAFASDKVPAWGFFFMAGEYCTEAKGTSLDVYEIIERAWRDEQEIVLRLDGSGNIVGADTIGNLAPGASA